MCSQATNCDVLSPFVLNWQGRQGVIEKYIEDRLMNAKRSKILKMISINIDFNLTKTCGIVVLVKNYLPSVLKGWSALLCTRFWDIKHIKCVKQ